MPIPQVRTLKIRCVGSAWHPWFFHWILSLALSFLLYSIEYWIILHETYLDNWSTQRHGVVSDSDLKLVYTLKVEKQAQRLFVGLSSSLRLVAIAAMPSLCCSGYLDRSPKIARISHAGHSNDVIGSLWVTAGTNILGYRYFRSSCLRASRPLRFWMT